MRPRRVWYNYISGMPDGVMSEGDPCECTINGASSFVDWRWFPLCVHKVKSRVFYPHILNYYRSGSFIFFIPSTIGNSSRVWGASIHNHFDYSASCAHTSPPRFQHDLLWRQSRAKGDTYRDRNLLYSELSCM